MIRVYHSVQGILEQNHSLSESLTASMSLKHASISSADPSQTLSVVRPDDSGE